MENLIY